MRKKVNIPIEIESLFNVSSNVLIAVYYNVYFSVACKTFIKIFVPAGVTMLNTAAGCWAEL